jgi:hypothetical protein
MARSPAEEERTGNLNSTTLDTMPVRPAPHPAPHASASTVRALIAHRRDLLDRSIRPPRVRAHLP